MEKAGIYPYFDSAIFGDMVPNAKPDPEIYQRACENPGILRNILRVFNIL